MSSITAQMKFILIKESIIKNVLGPYAEDEFDLIGHLKQTKDAENISQKSIIQVFFTRSQIDWGSTKTKGNFIHMATYQIDVTVAVKSEVDIAVINNPESTPAQKIKALDQTLEATAIADNKIDELYALIISIIRDPRNNNLGVDPKIVKLANVRPEQFEKNDPLEEGGLVVCTATLILTCRVPECVSGEEGILNNKVMNANLEINKDTHQETELQIDSIT